MAKGKLPFQKKEFYEKKPIVRSERDIEVLESRFTFMVRIIRDGNWTDVDVRDAGQCVAAMDRAARDGARCLVYAVGRAFGERCMALVDREYLVSQI